MIHSHQEIAQIRATMEGAGGGVTVISGGESPYYAGADRKPADTLLEAVLTFLAAGTHYQEIVICTGQQCGGHLPKWHVGNMAVGQREGIWLLRGDLGESTARKDSDFGDLGALMDAALSGERTNRGILVCHHQEWPVRIEELLKQVEVRAGINWMSGPGDYEGERGDDKRSAVVIDFSYLLPKKSEKHYPSAQQFELALRTIEERFEGLPAKCAETTVDLYLLCRDKNMAQSLENGNILNGVHESFPELGWGHGSHSSIVWPGFDRKNVMGRYLEKMAQAKSPYTAFATTPVRVKESTHRGIPRNQYIAPQEIWDYLKQVEERINNRDTIIAETIRNCIAVAGHSEEEAVRIAKREYEQEFNLNYLLLYGPPGTGKTTLVNVIANTLGPNVTVYDINPSKIGTEGLVDKSVQKLNEMFQQWKSEELCIVYFNEADSLLVPNDHNKTVINEVKSMLLPSDGSVHTNIIFIADTNNAEHMDPAVSDRFKTKLYIGLPSVSARKEIIRKQIEACKYVGRSVKLQDVDEQLMANLLEGRSGRDIDNFFTFIKSKDRLEITITRKILTQWLKSNPKDLNALEAVRKYEQKQLGFERDCEAYFQQRSGA